MEPGLGMKIKFVIKCLLLATFTSFSAGYLGAAPFDQWHWRNPLPNGNPEKNPYNTVSGLTFGNGQFVHIYLFIKYKGVY